MPLLGVTKAAFCAHVFRIITLHLLFQQMQFFKSFYFIHQKLLLSIRETRKGNREQDEDDLEQWEDLLHEMDKVFRDRMFILTIAAEKGWKIAGEVAFRKKGRILVSLTFNLRPSLRMFLGNMSDKDLAKVMRDENKKRTSSDAGSSKPKKPHKKPGGYYRQNQGHTWNQGYSQYPAAVFQPPPPPPPLPSAPYPYQNRDPRTCLICKQSGHLYRNCPNRQGPAPK